MDELAQASAVDLTARLRRGELSSSALLDHYLARIERLDGPIGAVVTIAAETARVRARELDLQLARGGPVGPLHGLPMTIKDAYEVAGVRSTGGAERFAAHVPAQHAVAVQRLVDAGAVVFGKTNVPEYSGDLQTYNGIFGTTHNPYDRSRTPGGSSGGAAAALACGFTGLELGSDIGGSIRTPASWCGIFGHKPTYGLVPQRGHIPGPPGSLTETDLNVCGPLARSAADLELALDVLAGPIGARARAYRLQLPGARQRSPRGLRVAAWLDDAAVPVDSAVRELLERACEALRGAGAIVDDAARPGLALGDAVDNYFRLLHPAIVSGMPRAVLDALRAIADGRAPADEPMRTFASNATAPHTAWLSANERRLRLSAMFEAMFDHHDVLLCPVHPVAAIPHDQAGTPVTRTITVNGEAQPYVSLMGWISLATQCGLPATVAPVGRTAEGLPIGIQIVGAEFEDRTTIAVAAMLEELLGGFRPPSGF